VGGNGMGRYGSRPNDRFKIAEDGERMESREERSQYTQPTHGQSHYRRHSRHESKHKDVVAEYFQDNEKKMVSRTELANDKHPHYKSNSKTKVNRYEHTPIDQTPYSLNKNSRMPDKQDQNSRMPNHESKYRPTSRHESTPQDTLPKFSTLNQQKMPSKQQLTLEKQLASHSSKHYHKPNRFENTPSEDCPYSLQGGQTYQNHHDAPPNKMPSHQGKYRPTSRHESTPRDTMQKFSTLNQQKMPNREQFNDEKNPSFQNRPKPTRRFDHMPKDSTPYGADESIKMVDGRDLRAHKNPEHLGGYRPSSRYGMTPKGETPYGVSKGGREVRDGGREVRERREYRRASRFESRPKDNGEIISGKGGQGREKQEVTGRNNFHGQKLDASGKLIPESLVIDHDYDNNGSGLKNDSGEYPKRQMLRVSREQHGTNQKRRPEEIRNSGHMNNPQAFFGDPEDGPQRGQRQLSQENPQGNQNPTGNV
jgi:hypothetical protein